MERPVSVPEAVWKQRVQLGLTWLRDAPRELLAEHRSALASVLARAGPAISDLPEIVLAHVAILLAGPSSFAWCAANRRFQSAQPALRVLVLGALQCPPWCHHHDLARRFQLHLGDGFNSHRIIERIPPRHASTITHLYVQAVQGCVMRCADAVPTPNLRGALDLHGQHLRALQAMHIEHRPAGFTGSTALPKDPLELCAMALIRSTASTLRILCIDASTRMPWRLIVNNNHLLRNLEYVRLNLQPFRVGKHAIGRPEDTELLQRVIKETCPRAVSAVKCHSEAVASRRPVPPSNFLHLASLDSDLFVKGGLTRKLP